MGTKRMTQAELRVVGHVMLTKIVRPQEGPPPALSIEEFIGVGILATLLRIADDLSALVGIQNTTLTMEGHR